MCLCVLASQFVPLTGVCGSKAAQRRPGCRRAAALLDRGWGKPAQPHTGEDGNIRVVIRTITEGAPPIPSCRVLLGERGVDVQRERIDSHESLTNRGTGV